MSLQKWADNGWLRASGCAEEAQEMVIFVAKMRDDVRQWIEVSKKAKRLKGG